MQNFSIHDEIKLKDLLKEYKIKPFRYSQIENAIYKNFIKNFDDIKTIPKDLQKLLQKNCFFDSLKVDSINNSSNKQTTKILFKTKTDKPIESVIMRHLT
jgi:adenine C2-methylase RlmN of 23S rRNA A2503 and tRNA A37